LASCRRDGVGADLRLAESPRDVCKQDGVGAQRGRDGLAGGSFRALGDRELEAFVAAEEHRERVAVDPRVRQQPIEPHEHRDDLLLAAADPAVETPLSSWATSTFWSAEKEHTPAELVEDGRRAGDVDSQVGDRRVL
jgi:hypothetical protein